MAKKLEKLQEKALKYRDGLNYAERARYDGKLKLLDGEDPYEMLPSEFSDDVKLLPKITYPDIVNYLVFSPSPYTSDDLKSYKGSICLCLGQRKIMSDDQQQKPCQS
jgi:hypothetical protein